MTDGAELLSRISGTSRGDVLTIWDKVKENHRKLNACVKHRFPGGRIAKIGDKVTCLECGGQMGLVNICEYIAGYVAHGGSADDIWPGFNKKKTEA